MLVEGEEMEGTGDKVKVAGLENCQQRTKVREWEEKGGCTFSQQETS